MRFGMCARAIITSSDADVDERHTLCVQPTVMHTRHVVIKRTFLWGLEAQMQPQFATGTRRQKVGLRRNCTVKA